MWIFLVALPALPLLAMRVTDAVLWDGADFAAAAMLAIGVGTAIEIICRRIAAPRRRTALVALTITLAGLIWADGAVGIF